MSAEYVLQLNNCLEVSLTRVLMRTSCSCSEIEETAKFCISEDLLSKDMNTRTKLRNGKKDVGGSFKSLWSHT